MGRHNIVVLFENFKQLSQERLLKNSEHVTMFAPLFMVGLTYVGYCTVYFSQLRTHPWRIKLDLYFLPDKWRCYSSKHLISNSSEFWRRITEYRNDDKLFGLVLVISEHFYHTFSK